MYSSKTRTEILGLLDIEQKLTFSSKLLLLKEFDLRGMLNESTVLHKSIDEKIGQIEDLAYLKNIGFKAEKEGDKLKVTRTLKAILVDVLAVFLGLIFSLIGISGIAGLLSSFGDESSLNVITFITIGMELTLGYFGIQFLSGFERLINLSNFEMISIDGYVRLTKRFDYKTEVIQETTEKLKLREADDKIMLFLGENEVMSANAKSIVQKMTIEALIRKLR